MTLRKPGFMDEKIASIDLGKARLPVKTEVASLLEESQQKDLLKIGADLAQERTSLELRHDNASLFGRAVAFFDKDENKRIEKLKVLEGQSWALLYAQEKPTLLQLNQFAKEAKGTLNEDKKITWLMDASRQLLSGGAWTASCFMKGRAPLAGNFLLGATDAPLNTAQGSNQILPLRVLAGGTQSLVARYGVNKIAGVAPTVRWHNANDNYIMKSAVGGGLIYRASYGVSDKLCQAVEATVSQQSSLRGQQDSFVGHSALDGKTFSNAYQSNSDIWANARELYHQVFNPTNMGVDLFVGGLNRKLSQEATRFLPGPIANNPYFATRMSATTFGASSGAFNEINRQVSTGEQFDFGKVVCMSLANSLVSAFASIPGARQVQIESHNIHRDTKIALPNIAQIPNAIQDIKNYSRSDISVPKTVTGKDSIFVKQDMTPKEMLKIKLVSNNYIVAPLSYEKHLQNVQIKKGKTVPGIFEANDSLAKSGRTISSALNELNTSYRSNKILPETIAYQLSFLPNPRSVKQVVLLPGFDKHGLNNFNPNAINSTMFVDTRNKSMYIYLKDRTYEYGKGEKINNNSISAFDIAKGWSRLVSSDGKYKSQTDLLEIAAKRDGAIHQEFKSPFKFSKKDSDSKKSLYADDELVQRTSDVAAESLLTSDARTFLRFVHNNPTQAAIWSIILEKELNAGKGLCRNEAQLHSRLGHIKTYVLPKLQEKLSNEVISATRAVAKASPESVALLGCLGNKSHLNVLKAVAGIKDSGTSNRRQLEALVSIGEIVKRENITDPKELNSCISIASKLGNFYMQNKEYARALRAAKEMHGFVQKLPQDSIAGRKSQADVHELMADSYRKLGKRDKAIEHYVEAKKVNESLYGLNSRQVSDNLWQLSKIYNLNDVMCESLRISSIECLAKSSNFKPEMLAWRQGELARFYFARSKFSQALPLFEQAVKVLSVSCSDKNVDFAQLKTFRDCSREQVEK